MCTLYTTHTTVAIWSSATSQPAPPPTSHSGLSERALADYCISLGKRARDVSSLAASLEENGLPPGSSTRQFAADLLARLPRGGGSAAAAAAAAQKQREAEAAAFARKQQQYSLLIDEEDDEEQRRRQQQEAQRQRQQQQDGGGGKDGGKDGSKKHLRRSKAELDGEDETVVKKRSRKRAWEEEEGGWSVPRLLSVSVFVCALGFRQGWQLQAGVGEQEESGWAACLRRQVHRQVEEQAMGAVWQSRGCDPAGGGPALASS